MLYEGMYVNARVVTVGFHEKWEYSNATARYKWCAADKTVALNIQHKTDVMELK